MEPDHDDAVRKLALVLSRIEKLLLPSNSSASNVNINAGGPAVWIATTACIAMLAVNIVLVAIIIDYGRRIDRVEDYSYAAYMISGKQQEKSK